MFLSHFHKNRSDNTSGHDLKTYRMKRWKGCEASRCERRGTQRHRGTQKSVRNNSFAASTLLRFYLETSRPRASNTYVTTVAAILVDASQYECMEWITAKSNYVVGHLYRRIAVSPYRPLVFDEPRGVVRILRLSGCLLRLQLCSCVCFMY